MPIPLPQWLKKRYVSLLKKYGSKEFKIEEVMKYWIQNYNQVSSTLWRIKNAGWLTMRTESKKGIFKLIKPTIKLK